MPRRATLASQPAMHRARGGAGHVDAATDQDGVIALGFPGKRPSSISRDRWAGGESASLFQ